MPLLTKILKPELLNSTTLAKFVYERRIKPTRNYEDWGNLSDVEQQLEVDYAKLVLDDLQTIGIIGSGDPVCDLKQAAAEVCKSAGVRLSAAPGAAVVLPLDDPILAKLPITLGAS